MASATNTLRTAAGAVATQQQKPQTIAGLMADPKIKQQMALALPKHMTADRLARIATTEIRRTPMLARCDKTSFLGAIMQCAQLGLEPGGAFGHAYLLPFNNRKKNCVEVQFIVGYRGMIDLARRSGQIISLSARAVYENDEFSYEYGLDEKLHHKPYEKGDPGRLTHVYAVAKLKDGGVQFEVMSIEQVNAIKAQSKSATNGPWVSHFEEMAKKTVIRRLFKYLPVSIELKTAVALDERTDAGVSQDNSLVVSGEFDIVDDGSNVPTDEPVNEVLDPEGVPQAEEPSNHLKDAISAVQAGDIELAQDIMNSLNDADKSVVQNLINSRMKTDDSIPV